MLDHTNAGDRWIPQDEYDLICARVPILCVDLLPILGSTGTFGLIERVTYGGGVGLNLVGGAVLLDEPLPDAVQRHLTATLGSRARLDESSLILVGVYQYFKTEVPGRLHDPRKNAVSVTYAGVVSGETTPRGEARSFTSFPISGPPPLEAFGFGQGPVVYDGLSCWRQTLD